MKPEDQMREAWDNAILPNTAIVRLAFEDGYRAAEKALAHRDAQPAGAQEPVLKATGIHTEQDGKLYQFCEVLSALMPNPGTQLYTEAPAVAINEHLLEALKSTGLFLHHCWCDVQMNDYSFEKLGKQMEIVDAAIAEAEKAKGGGDATNNI